MTYNIAKFLSIALLASSFSAAAQESKHISLNEAVNMSLSASKQLRASAARVQQSSAFYKEAKERRLPDFSISGSYLRLLNTDLDLKIKTGGSDKSGTTGEQPAQSGALPFPNNVAYALANASLPVFAGFKIQSGIESAKYLNEAMKLDAEKDREEIIQNTIAAYSNLYKASAAVALVEENLKQSKERVRELSNMEQNGLLARNDLLKAQLQQSNVELSLLDAQSNYRVANQNMNLMLGLPEETVIETDSVFETAANERNLAEWEATALQNRKDAAALGLRAKAAEAGIRFAKSDYYPSLALTGGYIGAYVENIVTIKDAVNVGVGLKYSPSSLWKTDAKVAQAKARLTEIQANEGMLEDGIRLQTAQAYEHYLLNKKKIEVYALAVEQSQENFRIVNNKYHNSLATTTDLLDADVAQLQAKLNYAFAKADAAVSYKKLLQTAGILDVAKQ